MRRGYGQTEQRGAYQVPTKARVLLPSTAPTTHAASRRLAELRDAAAVPVPVARPRKMLWAVYGLASAVMAVAAAWRWL